MLKRIVKQSNLSSLYNPENIFWGVDGGGAGNNWAVGYSQADASKNLTIYLSLLPLTRVSPLR